MASSSNPLATGAAIDTSDVEVPAEGGPLTAHLARPSGGGAAPGIVVIHENRGLVPYVRDVADGLASEGYIAVAPDLLSREGGTASITDIPPVLSEIPRERHTADALACIAYLQGLGATRIGIIGFCFGGGVVWRTATASPDLAAVVPFYGAEPAARRRAQHQGGCPRGVRREGRADQRGHRRHQRGACRRGRDGRAQDLR